MVPGAHGPWIVQRPKVIFNNHTGKYVMYFHLDQPKHKAAAAMARNGGYEFRRVGTATADYARGPYTFVAGFQPDGIPSLDMNLFCDPLDGSAYLIRDWWAASSSSYTAILLTLKLCLYCLSVVMYLFVVVVLVTRMTRDRPG